MNNLTREDFIKLDTLDPIKKVREEFALPKDIIYFDGNSLGPLPKNTIKSLDSVIQREWGDGLVRSWNDENWINLPRNLGNQIAPLIGAKEGEVIVVDSTSVNLFKVLSSALLLNKNRKVIVSESGNFPSDLYILEGVNNMFGESYERCLMDEGDEEIEKYIDSSTAVVVLSHINYKTGRITDIKKITTFAHEKGALVVWDISHSVGVLPMNLHDLGVDFAVGCTYKHLNGGPGAPGFLFVHSSLIEKVSQPLTGWLGHIKPFDFEVEYKPANDINKFICGTPPIIAYKAIESGLEIFKDLSIIEIREKSTKLSEMFIQLMKQECTEFGFTLFSPKNSEHRGSQISFLHENAYSIIQALISHGIIGDYREPNVMRFGISPLYMRFEDVWNAITCLREIMQTGQWQSEKFKNKNYVT
jgi:kynureninase